MPSGGLRFPAGRADPGWSTRRPGHQPAPLPLPRAGREAPRRGLRCAPGNDPGRPGRTGRAGPRHQPAPLRPARCLHHHPGPIARPAHGSTCAQGESCRPRRSRSCARARVRSRIGINGGDDQGANSRPSKARAMTSWEACSVPSPISRPMTSRRRCPIALSAA
jgi:hypothetical protein